MNPHRENSEDANKVFWRLEDFLHFLSAFNERAPIGLKYEVAFFIYDQDQDGYLSHEDVKKVVKTLVGADKVKKSKQKPTPIAEDGGDGPNDDHVGSSNPYDINSVENLTEEEYDQIVEQVFHEADLDRDRKMAPKDFANTMDKFPDFSRHFCVPEISNYV